MEGWYEWEKKGATCTSTAGQVRIGWLKCPLKGWLCPGKGIQRTQQKKWVSEDLYHYYTWLWWVLLDQGWKCIQRSHFHLIRSAKWVIIPSFPSPTPSITKIAKGVISVLIALLPTEQLFHWVRMKGRMGKCLYVSICTQGILSYILSSSE